MSAFHTHFVEQFSVGFGLPRENSSIIIFKRYSIAKTVNIGVFFFQNAKNMWIATAPNATAGIHFTAILFARFSRTRSPRVCFFPPSERLRDVPKKNRNGPKITGTRHVSWMEITGVWLARKRKSATMNNASGLHWQNLLIFLLFTG